MLSKQSIRKEHTILLEGVQMSKEENGFRKMLKQGGKISIQGKKFEIKKYEYKQRNSKGEFDQAAKPHRDEDWE